MKKMMRIWVRAFGVWLLSVIVTANFFVDYLGIVNVAGIIVLMGSFLIFAFLRVVGLFRNQPLPAMEEEIPEETGILVVAETTGRTNQVRFAPRGQSASSYTEYEITYNVAGREYTKWFHIYPGPDLGDVYGEGRKVLIRCKQENPDQFELLEVCEE